MDQDQAINNVFRLAEVAQSRGAWTLEEAHTIWESRKAFVRAQAPPVPPAVPIHEPEPEPVLDPEPESDPNLDDTAAE